MPDSLSNAFDIILASASPRRRELLDQLGVSYRVNAVDIDESVNAGEKASDYVERMALEKMRCGYSANGFAFVTLGADTCIAVDDEILGKPLDASDAASILQRLSGRSHSVYSAVAVCNAQIERVMVNCTEVRFVKLEQSVIDAYIETGEPLDKAGAYAIQGVAAQFITQLTGSYSSVMGLPLYETSQLLNLCGIKTL